MRRHTHPPAARARLLIRANNALARRTVGAGTAILTLAILATGKLSSPLLPLLAPVIWLLTTMLPSRAARASTVAVLTALAGVQAIGGGFTTERWISFAAVALACIVPVEVWRRAAAGRDARLEDAERILREAARATSPSVEAGALQRLRETRRALDEVRAQLGARRVALWDVAGEPPEARQRAASDGHPSTTRVRLRGDPLGWIWHEGAPLRYDEPPHWAAADAVVHGFRVGDPGPGATLLTCEFAPDRTPPEPAALAGAVSQIRSFLAMQDERAHASADRSRLGALISTLQRLPAQLEPQAFGTELLDSALELTGATGGAVATWLEDGGVILAASSDDGGPAPGDSFGPLESEFALAARAGALLVREGLGGRSSRTPIGAPGERWTRPPRAVAVLPLHSRDEVVGLLGVWDAVRSSFETESLDLLRSIGPYAAYHFVHALAYGRMKENADRDALTGLPNRRTFERELAAETARLERYQHPLSLVVLDIDHFKSINDRHGHEAGDAVLRAVARTLRATVRDVDVPARLGGEEFAVLLPETGIAPAADVAERLRVGVEALDTVWAGESISVRISAGVACCPTSVAAPSALLSSADAALYQAKNAGRNRVVNAPARG